MMKVMQDPIDPLGPIYKAGHIHLIGATASPPFGLSYDDTMVAAEHMLPVSDRISNTD